jgi:DNA endonuclease
MELANKGLGGIRIARELSKIYALEVCPGTINHWIYGDRKPRLRNIFNEGPSPSLSYIIGANRGDGCVLTKSGCVKLEVTDKDFAETFNSKMAELFSRERRNKILVRRFHSGRLPLFIVKYSSKQLARLMLWPTKKLLRIAFVFPSEFLRGFSTPRDMSMF